MTTSEYFILFTVSALLILVRVLDRKFQGRMNADDAEALGRFSRISNLVSRKEAKAEMRLAMGIRQQVEHPDSSLDVLKDGAPA